MDTKERAVELFKQGYNCAQATYGALAEEAGEELDAALKLSCPFGGGMGRMREVCGAVSGAFLALGLKYADATPDGKQKLYPLVQRLAEEFKKENGSIVCRELLGGSPPSTPVPTERTEAFYKKRPCSEYVALAVELFKKIEAEEGNS